MGQLRLINIDLTTGTVQWVAAYQNTKREHVTPLTSKPLATLKRARRDAATIGDGWLFSSSRSDDTVDRRLLYRWWATARTKARFPSAVAACHMLLRELASKLVPASLKIKQTLGR